MVKKIYPEIDIITNDNKVIYESFVRKQHTDGKYYLVHFKKDYTFVNNKEEDFKKNVNYFMACGVIDTKGYLLDVEGNKIMELDENQY